MSKDNKHDFRKWYRTVNGKLSHIAVCCCKCGVEKEKLRSDVCRGFPSERQ